MHVHVRAGQRREVTQTIRYDIKLRPIRHDNAHAARQMAVGFFTPGGYFIDMSHLM